MDPPYSKYRRDRTLLDPGLDQFAVARRCRLYQRVRFRIAERANVENEGEEIVRLLIEAGADVEAKFDDGRNALIHTAGNPAAGSAAMLIEAGADVNVQSKSGWTALMRAARYGRTETVKLLIEAGADVNAISNDGETALMLATQYDHTGVVDILKQ